MRLSCLCWLAPLLMAAPPENEARYGSSRRRASWPDSRALTACERCRRSTWRIRRDWGAWCRREFLYLSAQDVVALTIENNLRHEVQRYGPLLEQEVLARARGGG